jgi:hypothetical protein
MIPIQSVREFGEMSFWNEAFYFEKRGDRYVYRHNILSDGYDISEAEKDALFAGLKRLQFGVLILGGVIIASSALLFMTGTIQTQMPILWFMISSILAAAILTLLALYRRDRLVSQVLGNRAPDVPRRRWRS